MSRDVLPDLSPKKKTLIGRQAVLRIIMFVLLKWYKLEVRSKNLRLVFLLKIENKSVDIDMIKFVMTLFRTSGF